MRDEHRDDYDEGRGGWGARQREEEQRDAQQRVRPSIYQYLYALIQITIPSLLEF